MFTEIMVDNIKAKGTKKAQAAAKLEAKRFVVCSFDKDYWAGLPTPEVLDCVRLKDDGTPVRADFTRTKVSCSVNAAVKTRPAQKKSLISKAVSKFKPKPRFTDPLTEDIIEQAREKLPMKNDTGVWL